MGNIKGGQLNINNANFNLCRITRSNRRLSSLIKANNIKNINIDIGRTTRSGLIKTLIQVVVVINNTPTQRDVPDYSMVTDDVVRE